MWQCSELMVLHSSAFPCFICFLLMTLNKGVISSCHLLVHNVLSAGSGQDLDGSQQLELEDANSYACYNGSGPLSVGPGLALVHLGPLLRFSIGLHIGNGQTIPFPLSICVLMLSKLIDNRTEAQTNLYTERVMCKTSAFLSFDFIGVYS